MLHLRLMVQCFGLAILSACSLSNTTGGPDGSNNSDNPPATRECSDGTTDGENKEDAGWNGDIGAVGIVWVKIEGGTFMMGCSTEPEEDEDCLPDEKPQHEVNLSAFEMAQTETTQKQYSLVMNSNPSKYNGNEDNPVDSVTWNDANAFCNKMGARLPTEAEWEYTARAGTKTKYYCGNSPCAYWAMRPSLPDWYDDIDPDDEIFPETPEQVPSGEKNNFGLFNMIDNVTEWVNDWYDEKYYEKSPRVDPSGPENGDKKIIRGGTWNAGEYDFRSSVRWMNAVPKDSAFFIGFRCARDLL